MGNILRKNYCENALFAKLNYYLGAYCYDKI